MTSIQISFSDCQTEVIAYNRDSTFLIFGDNLGTIHFVHVDTATVVFSQEISTDMKDATDDGEHGRKTFAWLGFVDRPGCVILSGPVYETKTLIFLVLFY